MTKMTNSSHGADVNQLQSEVLWAVRVSDDEVDATAFRPELYEKVRLHIAAEKERRDLVRSFRGRRMLDLLSTVIGPSPARSLILGAAMVLLIVAASLILWLPRKQQVVAPLESKVASPDQPRVSQPAPKDKAAQTLEKEQIIPIVVDRPSTPETKGGALAVQHPKKRQRSRVPLDEGSGEIATDFLPLTFTADVTAPESGHLVRVTMPRSALVSMGLPMNADRAGEFVRADVFFGDDGLARAIRFVQ